MSNQSPIQSNTIHNQGEYQLLGKNYGWLHTWVEHPDYEVIDLYVERYDPLVLSSLTSHIASDQIFFNDGGTLTLERGAGEFDTYAEIAGFFDDQQGAVQVGEYSQLLFSGGGKFDGTTFSISSSSEIDYPYFERPTLTFSGSTENYQLKDVTFDSEGAGGVVQLDGNIIADGTVQLGSETIWGSLIGQSELTGVEQNSQFINPESGRFIVTTGVDLPPQLSFHIPLVDYYQHTLSTHLVNQGLMETARGYIEIDLTPSGTIDNLGVLKLNALDGVDFNISLEGYTGSFLEESDNTGWHRIKGGGRLLNRQGGQVIKTGNKHSFIEVDFQNLDGQLEVQQGLLALEGGGTHTNSTITIAENGILRLANRDYHFTGAASQISNRGILESDGADWRVDNHLDLDGRIYWYDRNASHSSITGAGTLRNLGQLTMGERQSGATGGTINLGIQRFENVGQFDLNSGWLNLDSQLINQGTFNLQKTGGILGYQGEFVNHGTLLSRSAGTRISPFVTSHAGSIIAVEQGTLKLEGGSLLQQNSLTINDGATLELHVSRPNQTHTVDGTQLENYGTLKLGRDSERGPVLTVEGNGFTLNGDVIWAAGQIEGSATLRNQGQLNLENPEWLGIDLQNQVTGTVNQQRSLALRDGVDLINEGTWNLSRGTYFGLTDTIRPYLRNQTNNHFVNSGEVQMTASNIVSINVATENTGLFQISQGELRLKKSFVQSDGGQVVLAGGRVLASQGLTLQGGELIADGGRLTGALELGDVDVKLGDESGEIKTLTLSQSQYTDTDDTHLTFDIAQNSHDQISITSGSAVFDGIFDINLTNAAAQSLTVGDRIQIIQGSADLSSDGVELHNRAISETLQFALDDNANGIALVVEEKNTSTGDSAPLPNDMIPLPSQEDFNLIQGGDSTDFLTGTSQNDWFQAGASNDTLWDFWGGDDYFDGGAGNDRILAGGGDDTLDGGLGADLYQGGPGSDVFVLHVSDLGDTITDFELTKDIIDIKSTSTIQGFSLKQNGTDTLLYADSQAIAQFNNINLNQLGDMLNRL